MGIEEEEELKRQRRAEINAEIEQLSIKIGNAVEIENALYECIKSIRNNTDNWETDYTTFQTSELNKQIFLTDIFEGNQAENLSTLIPETTLRMEYSVTKMEELTEIISEQITLLQEYKANLQKRVQQLYIELMAI